MVAADPVRLHLHYAKRVMKRITTRTELCADAFDFRSNAGGEIMVKVAGGLEIARLIEDVKQIKTGEGNLHFVELWGRCGETQSDLAFECKTPIQIDPWI